MHIWNIVMLFVLISLIRFFRKTKNKAELVMLDKHAFCDWLPITFAQGVHQKSQRCCQVLASVCMSCPFWLFKEEHFRTAWEEEGPCTLSIFLLFCSLLLPSGGLTPTEESQLHKIGWNKQLIDLLTVKNPYLDIERHDLNKIHGLHAHVSPLHTHTCLQAYVHKLNQRASLYYHLASFAKGYFLWLQAVSGAWKSDVSNGSGFFHPN